ncbi:hypothetical protein B0T11DRAFT_351807 [Plectosphaerella cucumerina]|uniref:F-box domain-containing protein n=1 Tax=Plectosphaerella cucumerina TaxID=40658 RepID=A0A8K0X2S4_9PEZI|nr:hypothetical protein B0T11DRAFT_351807 [Plectosphaerella cucumerina]
MAMGDGSTLMKSEEEVVKSYFREEMTFCGCLLVVECISDEVRRKGQTGSRTNENARVGFVSEESTGPDNHDELGITGSHEAPKRSISALEVDQATPEICHRVVSGSGSSPQRNIPPTVDNRLGLQANTNTPQERKPALLLLPILQLQVEVRKKGEKGGRNTTHDREGRGQLGRDFGHGGNVSVLWAEKLSYLGFKPPNKAPQWPACFTPDILSKLPTDILFPILEELSLPDKLCLAQTCRAFQHVMYKVPYRDDSNLRHRHRPGRSMQEFLTVEEQLEFLCQVTRNRPDSWACHVCVAAHAKIDFQDTPRHKTLQNQMNHPCQGSEPIQPQYSYSPSSASWMLLVKHHHVQLLFKYLRRWEEIDDARRQYAQDIAASFTHRLSAAHGVSEGSLVVQVKMVLTRNKETGCQEPRLLLKTTRTYEEHQFVQFGIPGFYGCPHLAHDARPGRPNFDGHSPKDDHRLPRDAYALGWLIARPHISWGYREFFSGCVMCSSDFSVRIDKHTRCIITKWQDLGHETSTVDLWRAQTEMDMGGWLSPSLPPSSLPVEETRHPVKSRVWYHHEPGSLIKAYELPGVAMPWEPDDGPSRDETGCLVDMEELPIRQWRRSHETTVLTRRDAIRWFRPEWGWPEWHQYSFITSSVLYPAHRLSLVAHRLLLRSRWSACRCAFVRCQLAKQRAGDSVKNAAGKAKLREKHDRDVPKQEEK